MLSRREVRIGKCYVKDNKRIVREVIAQRYHRKVVYNAYNMQTGRLLREPHQICSVKQLIRWADREATSEESANLIRDEANDIFDDKQHNVQMEDPLIESSKSKSLTQARYLTPPR